MNPRDMSYWDFRLIFDKVRKEFIVGEVYYSDEDEPISWCKADVVHDSSNEVEIVLCDMIACLRRPTLVWDGKRLYPAKEE